MRDKELEGLFSLEGKVVVITGATGLLGMKHAEAVAAYGGTPIILDLNEELAVKSANRLSKTYNIPAFGYKVDITDEDNIFKNKKNIMKKFGRIDALINNAANNPKMEDKDGKNFSKVENFPLEVWNADIAVGLTGAYLCSKHYGSEIVNNVEGGNIINVSSDLGLIAPDQRLYEIPDLPDEMQPVKPITYSVVKSGLIGLTRYFSTYWADKNVRCNAICPGGVNNGQNPDFLQKVSSRIPLGRLANSNEYQGIIIFLLSDASSYMTGSIIQIDGGRTTW